MAESQIDRPDAELRAEPITADKAHRLRPGWTSRFDKPDIRNQVAQYPDISQWVPETGEYLIAGPWRHRNDIASVLELSGREGTSTLLRSFSEAARSQGLELALLSEQEESRNPVSYERAGFELLEHIMIYELSHVPVIKPERFRLKFSEMVPLRETDLKALLEIDHESFPWLWWNSEGEFLNYGRARGVKIYGGWDSSGRLVSYIGVTRFRSWGHLDRIAVRPELRGRGIGLESLEWALYVLAESGAKRIGLSTQARNERSRLLYERYGFHRTNKHDYYLYGDWLQSRSEQLMNGTNDDQ
ncbi:MAG: GNAT family N-acetyltransferase [Thermomicrobiaceae bacterium]